MGARCSFFNVAVNDLDAKKSRFNLLFDVTELVVSKDQYITNEKGVDRKIEVLLCLELIVTRMKLRKSRLAIIFPWEFVNKLNSSF